MLSINSLRIWTWAEAQPDKARSLSSALGSFPLSWEFLWKRKVLKWNWGVGWGAACGPWCGHWGSCAGDSPRGRIVCEKGPHLFPGGIDPVQCDPPRSQDRIWEVEKNNASSEKRRETLTRHLKATSVFKKFAGWTLALKATSQVKAAIEAKHFSSQLITLMANTGS